MQTHDIISPKVLYADIISKVMSKKPYMRARRTDKLLGDRVLMKKSLRILVVLISLTVIILLLWGNEIADKWNEAGNLNAMGKRDEADSLNETDSRDEEGAKGQSGTHTSEKTSDNVPEAIINKDGMIVQERILTPEGFERVPVVEGSFEEYLRGLPLKPHGAKVTYFNGGTKPLDVHVAVLDMDVGGRDLQQCADSVIRLRAEYLYEKGLYNKIHFNFTNGFNADYSKWMDGYRIKVSGNKADWVKQASKGSDYASFRKYLDMVFAYAGTLSLSKEMENIPLEEMQPGDVFLKGASPGHCVIVMDMAENKQTGEIIFIAAQGYMPAQEMHILENPANEDGNPWYTLDFGDELITPEWTFSDTQLYRFRD